MVIYAFAAVMVCWGVWGYQMAFGAQMIPGLVGIPRPIHLVLYRIEAGKHSDVLLL